ncbi:myotubularin-related protein 13-like isoform X2 [Sycon ciliatum]|uniref:myotubularin-related protein 13-like isoform X2 n=1 Tax=Sycon ciliatum TaxID=27933 RepID=UPI0020AB108A|eukprot:scpid6955/ scgid0258/ Myotubularin-related protein 5; SET-binding factor 1
MEDSLVDYFAVIGVKTATSEAIPDSVESHVSPVVLQRFPAEDIDDCPFPGGLEVLCHPQGWTVSHEPSDPTFFVFTLTDVNGKFSYCAVLTYYEHLDTVGDTVSHQSTISSTSNGLGGDTLAADVDVVSSYVPKCLCVLSRHPLYGAFRTLLCSMYCTLVTQPMVLPQLVSQIAYSLVVPPRTRPVPALQYQLVSGHTLSVACHDDWSPPFADGSVLLLFQLLGIRNVLRLVAALLAENKIVFLSSHVSHLQAASSAMLSLLYPLKFSYPLIPVLPATMDDFMAAPTPFIMGRLADVPLPESAEPELIVADLDQGCVKVGADIPQPPSWGSVTESFLLKACTMVLHPSWLTSDNAFTQATSVSSPERQEYELRAIFLNLWVYWLWGYRNCLTVQRIHENFSVKFMQDEFMRLRHLQSDDVLRKVMDSQALVSFIQDRGSPYRLSDFFDKAVGSEQCPVLNCPDAALRNMIKDLTGHFRSEEATVFSLPDREVREHASFPNIRNATVDEWKVSYVEQANTHRQTWKRHLPEPRIIAHGPKLSASQSDEISLSQDIALLKSCFNAIFEDQSESEANAVLRSLMRSLKSPCIRLELAEQLDAARSKYGTALSAQQFSVLSKLVNRALQADSGPQSVGLAELLLRVVTSFHTKLPSGTEQCLYTACQSNVIWKEASFWSRAFYASVQQHIVSMYINLAEKEDDDEDDDDDSPQVPRKDLPGGATSPGFSYDGTASKASADTVSQTLTRNFRFPTVVSIDAENAPRNLSASSSPMELVAEQLRLWPHLNPARQEELSAMEEATVFAQAILFASRMVWLQLPMDISDDKRDDASKEVVNFAQRFFSGKAATLGISPDHSQVLQDRIPQLVTMHREDLDSIVEAVALRRSEEKERMFKPDLLDRETLYSENVHCFLLPDGRDVGLGVLPDGPLLLPAEGVLFISSYRIIFKGTPLDCSAGDGMITRTMPLAAIFQPKKLSLTGLPFGSDGLLVQSTTFQVMRLCFSSNVSTMEVDRIIVLLEQMRFPSISDRLFCYSKDRPSSHRLQHRNQSLKHDPDSSIVPADSAPKVMRRGDRWTVANADSGLDKEYGRLRLDVSGLSKGDTAGKWRMSLVNRTYRVCTTYPSTVCVPASCSDEQVTGVAQHFQQDRFPVAVWRSPDNGVVILRSGAPFRRSKDMPGIVSRRSDSGFDVTGTGINDDSPPTKSTKSQSKSAQDNMISADVIAYLKLCCSPRRRRNTSVIPLSQRRGNSLDSVVSPSTSSRPVLASAPAKDVSPMQSSWGRDDGLMIREPLLTQATEASSSVLAPSDVCPLYIIGSKPLSEELAPMLSLQLVFLPVESPDVRAIRHSFRKLVRACAPPEAGSESSHFYSAVEESGWMEQLQCIMRLAGAVVDLVDVQCSPVLVCLEDGWDVTPQVTALSQLCLDPYYRTVDGFEVLIEKEWLSLGHRFSRRGQHVEAEANEEFAPVFLQFLDTVHQLLLQFPLSFEFNHHFLEFLAYHQSALSYSTFTLDSEIERISLSTMDKDGRRKTGRSVWRHIRRQWSYSPVFCNLSYNPNSTKVLRPYSGISDLRLWQYYVRDSLTNPTRYDIEPESTPFPTRSFKDMDASTSLMATHGLPFTARNVLELPVANGDALLVDHISCLLCEHRRLSSLVSDKASPWQKTWRAELAAARTHRTEEREREVTLAKSHSLHQHRRTSVEVLLKGKLTGQAQQAFSYPHRFVMHSFKTPTVCDSCKQLMWGVIRQGLQCADCSYNSHYRCKLVAPSNCNEFKRGSSSTSSAGGIGVGSNSEEPVFTSAPAKPPTALARVTESLLAPLNPDSDPGAFRARSASSMFYMQPTAEKFHEGFLYKRGGIRKNWKMRWFVLNSEGMELCYYNAFQETHLRGTIDLEEVAEVNKAPVAAGAPLQENGAVGSFFEIVTPKRTFLLMATNDELCQKWMGAINGSIQLQRNLIAHPSSSGT